MLDVIKDMLHTKQRTIFLLHILFKESWEKNIYCSYVRFDDLSD
jgi:hypothetical protein